MSHLRFCSTWADMGLCLTALVLFCAACGGEPDTVPKRSANDAGIAGDAGDKVEVKSGDGGSSDTGNLGDASTTTSNDDTTSDASIGADVAVDALADGTKADDAGSSTDIDDDSAQGDTGQDGNAQDGNAQDGNAQDGAGGNDAVSGPQPCSPTLVVTPAINQILPYDLKTFKGSGGTGDYRFNLKKNASGAVVNKYSGAYLSGSKTGVTDVVRMSDNGCVGEVFAQMTIVEPMTMAPLEPWVGYKQGFTFFTTGGSGKFAFSMLLNTTAATINKATGAYISGVKDGDDQIQVTDTKTGETSTAVVHVRANSSLSARPPRLVVPIGTTINLKVDGGSGHFALSVPAGVFKKIVKKTNSAGSTAKNASRVRAMKAGAVMATLKDVFTGKSVKIALFAVAATEVKLPPSGDGYQAAHVHRVPDLNGDGGDEVVVAVAEADGDDNNSGAVYVYRSKKGGLEAKPAQILYGTGKDSRFGYGLTIADVDGDKRADLIVGAPLADVGSINNGAIYIYKGLKTGIFSSEPIAILKGPYNSDQLGTGVVVCDVNGDGVMDVAGGALYAEDRQKNPIVYSTGAVMVWLGHQEGFLAKPDLSRYGQLPVGGGKLKATTNSRIGWDLAAGDVDGDGVCDIAVSSLYYKEKAANDGLVMLYRGEKANASSLGGPTELPVRVWSGWSTGQPSTQFGRSIALVDLNGDGKDELVVGQLNWRGKPAKVGRGAVWAFSMKGFDSTPATKIGRTSEASWGIEGINNYDYYGYRIATAEATGDGRVDLLVQAGNGEVPKGAVNAGTVLVFAARKGALPLKKPTRIVAGLKGGDYFGLGMTAISDVDGDKTPEIVAFASQDDTLGYNLGRAYFAPSKPGSKLQPLGMPSKASGARFGWHTRFVGDINGDGYPDLGISAPFDPARKGGTALKPLFSGTRAGVTHIYKGTATGLDLSKPAWRAAGFNGHSAHDYLGWRIAPGGDFDGDGRRDLAIMARYDDRPSGFNSTFVKGTKCSGGARYNVAAVHIFRGRKGDWPSTTPTWVAWGPQNGQNADGLAMGMDINGDGLGDLVLSGLNWDKPGRSNAGGWGVYWGKKAAAKGTTVLCAPSLIRVGAKANDYLGRDVVAMHDVDGDGCDEFAVGADGEDHGLSAQGTVHVIFGWGPKCASMSPREVVLTAGAANARAGISLDAGADIDGDKIPDLLIGGYNYNSGSAAVGTAWVVTGAYLKTLKPVALVDGQPPAKLYPMVPPGSKMRVSVTGVVNVGQFGWSVAFVPGLEKDGRAGVLVGSPNGDVQSGTLTGGAELFRWMKTGKTPGFALYPMLSMAGESRPGGKLGYTVAAGLPKNGKPVLVMGGYSATPSTSTQIDQGAAYIISVKQP